VQVHAGDGTAADNNGSTVADRAPTAPVRPLRQDENHWRQRFNLSIVDPVGKSISTSAGHADVTFDMGAGAGLQAEYRLSPRFGIELGALAAAKFDISSRMFPGALRSDISVTGFAPFSLGLNVHLTPEQKFDVFVGPQMALVAYGSDHTWWGPSAGGYKRSIENDWAWGLAAGLDVPLGRRGWLFNTSLRYLETSVKQSQHDFHVDGEFNPVIFSVGIGYAF
jgi:outer membrane protein W